MSDDKNDAKSLEAQKRSDSDCRDLFALIGMYVILFQEMEGELDHILRLGWRRENWNEGHVRLARMNNYEKIEAVREIVLEHEDFSRVHDLQEWTIHFEEVLDKLHDERGRRNTIVHSQYLLKFCEYGLPPIRSHLQRGPKENGGYVIDNQKLSQDTFKQSLQELYELRMEINSVHLQLCQLYQAPPLK